MKYTQTIYTVGGEKQNHRPAYRREVSIQDIAQLSEDCFSVRIAQHAPNWLDDGYEIEVKITADQLFDYREFQKEVLRQQGILTYVPEVDEFECLNWVPYIVTRLSFYIGGGA